MKLDINIRPLRGSGLVQRYLASDADILPFFAGDPFVVESFQRRWDQLRLTFSREKRAAAAEALRPTSDAARSKIARFVREGGAVVTTGQQAGLFTGPLYTVYKTLTAIRLAEALEGALGVVVLPVFWTASEDHDWAEVNHAYVVDQRDQLRRLEVSSPDTRPLPMADRRLEPAIDSVLEDLAQATSGARYQADVMRTLRAAYQPGTAVAAAFGQVVASLFSGFDLTTTDAADPALKRASVPVLHRELISRADHEAVLEGAIEQINRMGFVPQVSVLPSAANVFLRTSHGRERLYADRGGWITRESRQRFSSAELERRVATEPGSFSPNVFLRPVVEASVFPVLAYVAGPGEIAYFAQLRAFFQTHGVAMPLVYPRASVLLVEERVQDLLACTGTKLHDLQAPTYELLRQRSTASLPPPIGAALHELRAQITRGFDHLADLASSGIDSSLQNAVGARRNRGLLLVADAEEKILRAIGRQQQEWMRAVEAARNHLFPLGGEQERVLNVLPFLAEHGPTLLPAIAAAIPIHWNGYRP